MRGGASEPKSLTSEPPSSAGEATRRVLFVHNWHRADAISGENRSTEGDIVLLRDAGVEVEVYSRSNDELKDFGPARWAGMALRPTVSPGDARALRKLIRRFRPDVVHLHNLLPLISPWVVRTAHAEGIPVVQTVHNYLHVCVAGTYFRDGHRCFDCRGRTIPWPAVLHACYHGSRLETGPLALSVAAHRSTWRLVDRFLADGPTVARHLASMGVDPRRIGMQELAVADPGPPPPPGEGAIFVGRLRAEKGSRLLLAAWERSGLGSQHPLRLVGDGPDEAETRRVAGRIPGVEMVGGVSHERTLELMSESAFLVVPSVWDEPGCTSAREAMARGRPVLATNLGVLPDIVDERVGWLVEATVDAMAAGLRAAFDAPLERLGQAARRRYEERFSPAVSLRILLDTYADCISHSRRIR